MLKISTILLVSVLSISSGQGDGFVRLSGGVEFNGGFVEVWREGAWRVLCDKGRGTWGREEARVVCEELGFQGVEEYFHGDSILGNVGGDVVPGTESVECQGNEGTLASCQINYGLSCPLQDVVSVHCRRDASSGCPLGSVPALGACYIVNHEERTFADAQNSCKERGFNLLEIGEGKENQMISRIVGKSSLGEGIVWTGGIVNEIAESKFKIWHGSQTPIVYHDRLDVSAAATQPMGIVIATHHEGWKTSALDSPHPYICEKIKDDIGCLKDDDPRGLNYKGNASRSLLGDCLRWNDERIPDRDPATTHNHCRNEGEDDRPICYVIINSTVTYDECNIPFCVKKSARLPALCKANAIEAPKVVPKTNCSVEEFECGDGNCLYNKYVCDGTRDCPGGQDEVQCSRLASLFTMQTGYKLEGITRDQASGAFRATEEECAKSCIYQKQGESGCCHSFSHRPGKDGKEDKCILGTVYSNQAFDSLIQKKSWNYFTLNASLDRDLATRRCRNERPSGTEIEGLRLMDRKNSEKIRKGNIVEVKIGGVWGGICDDGFNINEANVVCRQLGFHLGAQEAIKRANEKGDGQVILHDMICSGDEMSIDECNFGNHAGHRHQCDATEMAGVKCRQAERSCEEWEFHCKNGECISLDSLCDGIQQDCQDLSDEDDLLCKSPLDLRLVDGESFKSGRLEVRHKGMWGTVCNDHFGENEANVFCRTMGYDGNAHFEESLKVIKLNKPIWIHFSAPGSCSGNETSIVECHEKRLWEHTSSCDHSEDIVLACDHGEEELEFVSLEDNPSFRTLLPEGQSYQVTENCGLIRRIAQPIGEKGDVPRIAGGIASQHGKHPWQASIRIRGVQGKTYHHCGAVIVSPYHILTAAHCLVEYPQDFYYVRVGDNIMEVEDRGEQEMDIDQIDFHENFSVGPYLNNDIAVVHIVGPINMSDTVGPICLPEPTARYSTKDNITISGWGKNGYNQQNERRGSNSVSRLNEASIPIIDRELCKNQMVYGPDKISSGMFCAGLLEGGIDSCQGDSGGPAVQIISSNPRKLARATLMGLTSWGFGCGRRNKPGVYTKITKYVTWIYNKIKNSN